MPSLVQLYPNRISITPQRQKKAFHQMEFTRQNPSWLQLQKDIAVSNFQAVKNPFIISKSSKRKLMDSINSMYQLSLPRKIEMKSGKFIYNFRASFVTLTLPFKQFHSDLDIKSKCLNQFLIEITKHYGVQNYVWKAELQGNANIHFHLVLDKYIDFQALRRRWNRILNKLGYIAAYRTKFKNLNLTQYHAMRNAKASCSFEKSKAAFAAGKVSNWSNPNTVDVRSVSNKKSLAIYLSKYISKRETPKYCVSASLDRELKFGRCWSRSYSLAKLKYQNKYLLDEVKNLINYLNHETDKVLKLVGDFYTVYYFAAEKLSDAFQKFHKKFIFGNAETYRYPLPIPIT